MIVVIIVSIILRFMFGVFHAINILFSLSLGLPKMERCGL